MKTVLKLAGIAFILEGIIATAVCICKDSLNGAISYTVVPIMGAVLIFAGLTLSATSRICARKVDSPEKRRPDGTPEHPVWPLWTFLAAVIVIALWIIGCFYLATHIWCSRDLLNFTLFALLSMVAFYGIPRLLKL